MDIKYYWAFIYKVDGHGDFRKCVCKCLKMMPFKPRYKYDKSHCRNVGKPNLLL